MNLFPKELEKIGFSILHDDVDSFQGEYKHRLIIDDSKLIIFCVESLSVKILMELLRNHPIEYNSLSHEEKCYFFYELFKKRYKYEKDYINIVSGVFSYIYHNYRMSKELINFIYLNSAKYAIKPVFEKLSQITHLNQVQTKSLLFFIKSSPYSKEMFDFYEKIFVDLIKKTGNKDKNLNFYYNLLSLSVGAGIDNEDYCFEIEVFNKLPPKYKNNWINYQFKNDNLNFFTYTFSIDATKKNGYNKNDINVDFLYFFIKVLLRFKENYTPYELKKISTFKNSIPSNDFLLNLNYNDMLLDLESILLKHSLEKSLNKYNVLNLQKTNKI